MIEFTSKDPLIAAHYDFTFREEFEKAAALFPRMTGPEQEGLKAGWQLAMYREARRQEHYDYTTDDDGIRHLVRDANGKPKLLIPDVTVTP